MKSKSKNSAGSRDVTVSMKFRLSEAEIDLLKQALGANSLPQPIHWGWKNQLLAADPETQVVAARLQGLGLLRVSRGKDRVAVCHATRLGCLALGMSEDRIAVALKASGE